jgi:hypothetical protein
MSSVLARTKQIPTDSQYFVSIRNGGVVTLQYFVDDAAASTTSYVSGAAAGNFVNSNVTPTAFDLSDNTTQLFRDMGVTIISSGRTFRGVQLLTLDSAYTTPGSSGWTATTGAGVWKPSIGGVTGTAISGTGANASFNNFYFETGAGGLGLAQGLVRYG